MGKNGVKAIRSLGRCERRGEKKENLSFHPLIRFREEGGGEENWEPREQVEAASSNPTPLWKKRKKRREEKIEIQLLLLQEGGEEEGGGGGWKEVFPPGIASHQVLVREEKKKRRGSIIPQSWAKGRGENAGMTDRDPAFNPLVNFAEGEKNCLQLS